MKKNNGILALGLLICLTGNSSFAVNSTALINQNGNVFENKLCMGDEIMKELVKQTIYTVGSKVLNKYMNNNAPVYPTNPAQAYSYPASPTYTPSQDIYQYQPTTQTQANNVDVPYQPSDTINYPQ